jgi:hypothetical protein
MVRATTVILRGFGRLVVDASRRGIALPQLEKSIGNKNLSAILSEHLHEEFESIFNPNVGGIEG